MIADNCHFLPLFKPPGKKTRNNGKRADQKVKTSIMRITQGRIYIVGGGKK